MSSAQQRRAGLRIGDAERDDACAALGEHYASGRLTRAELDERTSGVWAARTYADLQPLFADLPLPHGGATDPTVAAGPLRARSGGRSRFPWLAFFLVLVVLTAVTNVPLILLAVALWLLMSRVRRWGGATGCSARRHYASGRSRAEGGLTARGSWA